LGALGYSSRRFPATDGNLKAFVPDVLAEPTIEDYLLGRDPALEAVWALAGGETTRKTSAPQSIEMIPEGN
jgi:hypothetical protein